MGAFTDANRMEIGAAMVVKKLFYCAIPHPSVAGHVGRTTVYHSLSHLEHGNK